MWHIIIYYNIFRIGISSSRYRRTFIFHHNNIRFSIVLSHMPWCVGTYSYDIISIYYVVLNSTIECTTHHHPHCQNNYTIISDDTFRFRLDKLMEFWTLCSFPQLFYNLLRRICDTVPRCRIHVHEIIIWCFQIQYLGL